MQRVRTPAPGGRTRMFHTTAAIALAVGLVAGTFILTDTIKDGFRQTAVASRGAVDVVVRMPSPFQSAVGASAVSDRPALQDSVLDSVQGVPGVASAWGTVGGWAQVVDHAGHAVAAAGLPTVGLSWTPEQIVVSGRRPASAGEVAVDVDTARSHHLAVGDRVQVLLAGRTADLTVSGLVKRGSVAATTLVAFDLPTAQDLFGRTGSFDAVSAKAAPGLNAETLRDRVATAVGARYEVLTSAQAAKDAASSWARALSFLTTALLVFSAVALVVGAFIIFNTFSIVVAQRTRELGLLRTVGATRGQLLRSVLRGAVRVGIVASAAGIGFGFVVARGMLFLLEETGYHYAVSGPVFLARTAVVSMVSGVGVTVLASLLPARRAMRVSPVTTLAGGRGGEGAGIRQADARRGWVGVGLAGAGAGLLVLAVRGVVGAPSAVAAIGAVVLLVGLVLLNPVVTPRLARIMALPVVRVMGKPAALGRDNASRNPRRTSAAATALMIGIGLVGVVAIMAASMKASASKTLRDTLRADFVVGGQGVGGGAPAGISPEAAARLRSTPGVAGVSEVRTGEWGLDGKSETLVAVDPATVASMHDLDPVAMAETRQLHDGTVQVRSDVASRMGWKVGDEIPMTFARTGTQHLRVSALFDTPVVRSDFVVTLGTFEANYDQNLDYEIDVRTVPGVSATAGRAIVSRTLAGFPNATVMDKTEAIASQTATVDSILVPVTALLALSVLIALLGIANTLALSIHERTRELGLLRAIGMARGQLRSMIRSEAMIIAAVGAALGIAVAVLFGWAPVASMRAKGVTELVIPVRQLAGLVVLSAFAGLLAGVVPARRAARLAVLEAVATD